jgi:O-antigen/teichoic acid export membrane protein
LGSGEIAARVVGFAISLYLARSLGASGYGAIGIAASLIHVLDLVVRGGTAPGAVRQIAQQPDSLAVVVGRVGGLRLTLAAATLGALLLALPLLSSAFGVPAGLVFLYGLGLLPVAASCFWALQGLEAMDVVAAAHVAERLLVLVGVLLLVHGAASDVYLVPVVEAGAAALVVLGLHAWLRRRAGRWLPIRFEPAHWPGLLREGVPVSFSLVLRTMYTHGDVLLLGWLASADAAGEFLVSHKLVLAVATVALVLREASFPWTSRLGLTDRSQAIRLQARILRLTLLALMPAIAFGFALAEPVIAALYGSSYAAATQVLRVTLFTLPVVALAGSLRALLLSVALPRHLAAAGALAVLAHVGLGLLLIPRLGAPGAGVACLIGQCVGAAVLATVVRGSLGGLPWDRRTLAPVVAGLLAIAVLEVTQGASLTLRGVSGGLAYLGAALAFGALRRDELRAAADYASRRAAARKSS